MTGSEKVLPLANLKVGDQRDGMFLTRATRIGIAVVAARCDGERRSCRGLGRNARACLRTEAIYTSNSIIPKGVDFRFEFDKAAIGSAGGDERLTVTTAPEQFTLFVTVSMYAAIAISIPLLLVADLGHLSRRDYISTNGRMLRRSSFCRALPL